MLPFLHYIYCHQAGPLYHRIGPCRKTGFIRGNNFTKMKPFSDQLIVRQMPEIDTDTTLLNGKFVLEEGFARRQGTKWYPK